MSPFCIRYDVQLDRRSGRIELRPQPGESPFSEFLLLMNELEGNQRDVTPHAYADAEALAHTADEILQGDQPAARWLFLADRALPSEAGMRSVRIWERREGMRDTFLAARDFGPLARLIRPVFAYPLNLTVTPEHMSRLLHQGARLLGSGVLDIIKKQDGQPDQKKIIGFAGLLLPLVTCSTAIRARSCFPSITCWRGFGCGRENGRWRIAAICWCCGKTKRRRRSI